MNRGLYMSSERIKGIDESTTPQYSYSVCYKQHFLTPGRMVVLMNGHSVAHIKLLTSSNEFLHIHLFLLTGDDNLFCPSVFASLIQLEIHAHYAVLASKMCLWGR